MKATDLEKLGITDIRNKQENTTVLYWGKPTEKFWQLWRAFKDELKMKGIWVSRGNSDEWIVYCRVKLEDAVAQSYAIGDTLEVPTPPGKALLPYQRAGVSFMLSHPKTLLADPMGLGKTIQVIGLLNVAPEIKDVLIVTPAGLRMNWARELKAWDVHQRRIFILEDYLPDTSGVKIINYDKLKKFHARLRSKVWDLIVLDEAHYLKNPGALRTQLVFGGKNVQGLQAKRWVSLTGTPILNRPAELWTHVRAYDPQGLGRDWLFYHQRYCDAKRVNVGGRMVWDVSGASNLEELSQALRARFMIRREKREVLSELPEKQRQIVLIEPEEEHKSALQSIEAERAFIQQFQQNIEDYEDIAALIKSSLPLVEFSKISEIRHVNALLKINYAAKLIVDGLDAEQKAVVFTWHRDVAEKVAKAINAAFNAPVASAVHGEQSPAHRQEIIDAFQTQEKPRVLVATMKAIGVGYNLTRADLAVFLEMSWTPADVEQAEDRLHRIGQKNHVLVQYIVFSDTLDAYIASSLARKSEILSLALGDKQQRHNLTNFDMLQSRAEKQRRSDDYHR